MAEARILVVDDDDDVREALVDVVTRAGYAVEAARDGVEAFDLLCDGRRRPTVMLLDLMMPRMDGWTLLERLAATSFRVPVIAVTASPDHGLPASMPLLRKPLRREELLSQVERLCPRRQLPKVELVLYVDDSPASDWKALPILELMTRYDRDEVSCEVRDIATTSPELLNEDRVTVAPTLIMRRPLPLRFVGELPTQRWLRTVLRTVRPRRVR